jgi:uncharacterized GH25 family protein
LALFAGSAWGHDFWIEPEAATTDPKQLELRLRVGNDLIGDSVPNIPDWYSDFSVNDGRSRFNPARGIGDDPAGAIVLNDSPGYLVGYLSQPEFTDLSEEKFQAYLQQEGLDDIAQLRSASDPRHQGRREFYQRCAKSLVPGGGEGEPSHWYEPLGYPLELTPVTNPLQGREVTLRLGYNGKPLAGRRVVAFTREEPEQKQLRISDADGRVTFDVNRPGLWLVKGVHMRPHDKENADWISYWASLTFRRGATEVD